VRVERLRAAYQIDVKFTHFPLHPDTPSEGLTLEQLFAGLNIDIPAAKARMAGLMADEGLDYGNRTMTYNSRLAQELAKWAETQLGGDAIHDALFRVYFVDGLNIALADTLVRVARQVGPSEGEAREVLDSRRFKDAVDVDWQRSRDLGVTGVPTFVAGDQAVAGAQPYEALENLVVKAGAELRH
jgi:predicted DsbA family dithiol-disulfide isomerase